MAALRENDRPRHRADGSHLPVDAVYWERLRARDPLRLCALTLFEHPEADFLEFPFLGTPVRLDLEARMLLRRFQHRWEHTHDPLLELATTVYLTTVERVYPLGRDLVGIRDLKEGHFFTGPHALRLEPLVERFAGDRDAFQRAGAALGGAPVQLADAACRLWPFPRVPLTYLLWEGDEEFPARVRVLLERSVQEVLPADALWALINRVTTALAGA
jgi:hypothetical protein